MSKVKTIAGLFWLIVFISAIPHCYNTKINTKLYLESPQVGDLYVTKLGLIEASGYEDAPFKSTLVGYMKLTNIDEDKLFFTISTQAVTRRGSLYMCEKFFDEELVFLKKEILELYNDDIIEKIRRIQ